MSRIPTHTIEDAPQACRPLLRDGTSTGDTRHDALADLVRQASADAGRVTDAAWNAARDNGWSDEQLAEAFAYVGLTVFTAYFLNYAQTELDIGQR